MDVTVTLPDELRAQAKEANLKLSSLLRDAVTEELNRIRALAEIHQGTTTWELDLKTPNGEPYTGRIEGTRLCEGNGGSVFLTDDGRLITHDEHRASHQDFGDIDDIDEQEVSDAIGQVCTDRDEYARVMNLLGLPATVDL